ncbi:glutamic acid-rich protein-like [Pyrus x bretschneideri]|uniref:glutamic acid-rich protein-like n=1 Tax=Pyrus x bretschneideri TaxID=225117 RepID=UPI00203099E9|nr:glutamic acid-rich protein-like [Pyrus x bretschneideri]
MEEVVEEKEVKPLTAEQLELYESQSESESESKSGDSVDEEEEDADEDDDADEGEEDDDDEEEDDDVEEEDDDVNPHQTALGRSGWQESTGLELGPARARSPANAGLPPSGNQY